MSIVVTSNFKTPQEAKPSEAANAPAGAEKIEAVASGDESAATGDEPGTQTLEASEPKTDETQESGEVQAKPKANGFEKRIKKLTKQAAERSREAQEAKDQAEFWRKEAQRLQGGSGKPIETKPEAKDGEPNPETFANHADYVRALAKWEFQQESHRAKQAERETAQRNEQSAKIEGYKARENAFKEAHKDFDAALKAVDDIKVSDELREALVDSEVGPDIAYHLAKNPDELERIAELSPLRQVREIGKLEDKFSTKPGIKTKSNAPKPIEVVNPGSSGSKSITDKSLSQKEYEAIRREQMASRSSSW